MTSENFDILLDESSDKYTCDMNEMAKRIAEFVNSNMGAYYTNADEVLKSLYSMKKRRKIVWPGGVDTAWYNQSETEFTINTPEQLAGFAKLVNNGRNFKDKTVMLGQNIVLNDTANWKDWANNPPVNEWVSIGIGLAYFDGIFDGHGYMVSGIYINSKNDCEGLFGIVHGDIKNLGVVNSYINGGCAVGGLAGYLGEGTISNCYSSCMVTGEFDSGSLVGYNKNGKVTESYYDKEIINEESYEGDESKGIGLTTAEMKSLYGGLIF
jgi:hypothetical protein